MNHFFSRFVASVGFCAVAAGCSTVPLNQSLPTAAVGKIASTEVVVSVGQSEILPTIDVSTGGAAFGLVGALVDAGVNQSRTSAAEKIVQPLRDALIDYDFDTKILTAVRAEAATVPVLGTSEVVLTKVVNDQAFLKTVQQSKADAVFVLNTDYVLTPDFSTIRTGIRALMFPHSSELKAMAPAPKTGNGAPPTRLLPEQAIYRATIIVESKLPAPAEDREGNAALWAAERGAAAKHALDVGIQNVVRALSSDIQAGNYSPESLAAAEVISVAGLPGKVVSKNDAGTLARRDVDGVLFFFPSAVTPEATPAAAPTP